MADSSALPDNPLYWPIADLTDAYRRRKLSPVEVLELALVRIDALNPEINAFLGRHDDLARAQALAAEQAYRRGDAGPLCGVPVSIKDTFQIENQVTTFGSLFFSHTVSSADCGVVRRLRGAGAVFTGRTNTAEFGQSATTENHFFRDVCNPWNVTRTTGGSSGGAAASVAAGLSTVALGADGGGSIRIPAAFAGLFGMKPTYGLCPNENGLAAMSDFISPGSISWCAADARSMLGVLADKELVRDHSGSGLKIGWCAHPENRPTDPAVDAVLEDAIRQVSGLGHSVAGFELPIGGWEEIFGPLVLAEESRERGHLLESEHLLTDYERKTLQAAANLDPADVDQARNELGHYRERIEHIFESFDFILTPTTAVTAFPIGEAPTDINGQRVRRTWGAFPFTSPFNVSGNPAASIPCGFADSLPVGLQLVAPMHADATLLDLAEELESELCYDRDFIIRKWSLEVEGNGRMAR